MRIYLLNGPPRSGKDTAGKMLAKMLDNAVVMKFATPLKMATHAMMAMLRGDKQVPGPEAFEDSKDTPQEFFFEATPRCAYINVSEGLCKKLFGKRVFGTLMVKKIKEAQEKGVENVVITDSGFQEEAQVLVDEFGAENTYLIRVIRPGTDFNGDSRGWIDIEGVHKHQMANTGERSHIRLLVAEMVGQMEEEQSIGS